MTAFDILFVADPRFPGGTSTGVASEIMAAHRAGFTAGLLMVKGPVLGAAHAMHPELRAYVDAGRVVVCDPADAISVGIAIIHHPTLFSNLPLRRLQVQAARVLLVVPHPEVDSAGTLQYDLARVADNIGFVFGVAPIIAPAGVNVRRSFRAESVAGRDVLSQDWRYLIDLNEWPARPLDRAVGSPIVIGRHARPDPAKWPDTREQALEVYPSDARFAVRVLGGGVPETYGAPPANWALMPFAHGGVSEFLRGLDFYVYFHSTPWVEAFGRTILEALATGLVVVLPPTFEPQFGSAALYAEPEAVRALIEALAADPERYQRQSRHARAEAERLYGPARYSEQIAAVAPELHPRGPAVPQVRSQVTRKLLFISSNGIGLGHLTRQMAIARRLSPHVKPLFLTMSHAFRLVIEQGYAGEFIPFHRGLGADPERWNRVLAEELFEVLSFHRPDGVVFDGNNPYPGMLDALATRPEVFSFWVRRPMWRQRHEVSLLRAGDFDFIIEPGEIAEPFDRGPTRTLAKWAFRTAPITYLDTPEMMSRDAAREELGVSPQGIVVSVQLGSGNNFDMSGVRTAVLDELLRHDGVFVVELRSPIRDVADVDGSVSERHRVVETYPSSRYLNAFDFAISAVGYNSFHENLRAGLPTLFVPNEAEEMDLQLSRARFADLTGLGRLFRRSERYRLAGAIAEMLDPAEREAMRARCQGLPTENGAVAAARFIEHSLGYVRTDVDIAELDFAAAAR